MTIHPKPWPLSTTYKLKDRIDTNPDYQRPAVWTVPQKQLLMDTILRGFDIPKLYLRQVATSPDKYEVVDGQQRLRAIWGYMNEEYSLAKDADPIDGITIAGKKYSELDIDISTKLDTYTLDFEIITETSEEEVREMFLRLQNGTTLKAQEKRHAMPGNMRDFICNIVKHDFFQKSVNFNDTRFTFEHIAAQMTLLTINGTICNIKDADLNSMYEKNKDFDDKGNVAKTVIKVLDYLYAMFPSKTPELKRYNAISLFILILDLITNYAVKDREEDLSKWFINFESKRAMKETKPQDQQDPKLVIYHEKTSHSTDALDSLSFRNEYLKEDLLTKVMNLPLKDPKRNFDEAQRQVIYRKDRGICQKCGKKCDWNDYEADHILPWNRGGQTVIENGQVLCGSCNSSKGDNIN